jgi:hypothetical protein
MFDFLWRTSRRLLHGTVSVLRFRASTSIPTDVFHRSRPVTPTTNVGSGSTIADGRVSPLEDPCTGRMLVSTWKRRTLNEKRTPGGI